MNYTYLLTAYRSGKVRLRYRTHSTALVGTVRTEGTPLLLRYARYVLYIRHSCEHLRMGAYAGHAAPVTHVLAPTSSVAYAARGHAAPSIDKVIASQLAELASQLSERASQMSALASQVASALPWAVHELASHDTCIQVLSYGPYRSVIPMSHATKLRDLNRKCKDPENAEGL